MAETTKLTIDGKEYELEKLPPYVQNIIVARQEIQKSKVRHEVELEKIAVLTDYYNKKIKEELDKTDGSDSKSNNWPRCYF